MQCNKFVLKIKMKEKEEIPYILYLYIHSILYKQTNGSHIISLKDAKSFLFQWKIPKNLRAIVIRELELIGLIEKIDRITLEIKRPTINLDSPEDFFEIKKSIKLVPE